VRAKGVETYRNEHGWSIIKRLERIAEDKSTTISAVALAWLRAQPTVIAPIASARTVEQLQEITPIEDLSNYELSAITRKI
jgi:aryl-alcohol dehydrogenase-like predicted oxidoreductase